MAYTISDSQPLATPQMLATRNQWIHHQRSSQRLMTVEEMVSFFDIGFPVRSDDFRIAPVIQEVF